MSIYNMGSPVQKGFIDRSLDKLTDIGAGFQRFNQGIAPIIQTAQAAMGIGSLAYSGIQGALDKGRLMTAQSSLGLLNSQKQSLSDNPESFSPSSLDNINKHIQRLDNFTNMYKSSDNEGLRVAADEVRQHSEHYKDFFSPDSITNRISEFKKANEERAVQDSFANLTSQTGIEIPKRSVDTSETHNMFNDLTFKLAEYTSPGMPLERIRGIENSTEEYMQNRNVNTREGINNCKKAIRDMEAIAEKNPNYLTLDTLRKMKYDMAVKSKRYER